MTRHTIFACAAVLAVATAAPMVSTAQAQGSSRAYTEGTVTVVTFVRTKPGMFDKYMQYLQSTYKKLMDAEKAAGIVVSYSVFTSEPRDAHDHDLALIVVYKNMAALDNLDDRSDAVANRIMGNTPEQRDVAAIDRESMREIIGSRVYRELVLK